VKHNGRTCAHKQVGNPANCYSAVAALIGQYLCMREIIPAAADADVQFAGQVGKLLIAQATIEQDVVELIQNRPALLKQRQLHISTDLMQQSAPPKLR